MISLSEFTIQKVEEANNSATFQISPLPTGYGQTLGNILRRVLLSSIPGAAITSVKIDGIDHEYSTMSGLQDDVLAVVLSLKNIVFLAKTETPVTLTLEAKGKDGGVVEVKASDIEKNSDVEVVNPDYVITKLTGSKAKLKMQLVVERGVGYQLPQEGVRQELGMLPVDAIFSPVKLVSISVTPARVGQQTELDQLNLEILTNGAVTPSDAMNIASNILNEMANNFVEQTKDMISGKVLTTLPTKTATVRKEEETISSDSSVLVSDLNLSTRLTNALLRSGFDDLRKLEGFTEEEVANIRGMGEKSLEELLAILKKSNIKLI